jgi:hypothetical protein
MLTKIVVSGDLAGSIRLDGDPCPGLASESGDSVRVSVRFVPEQTRLAVCYSATTRELSVEGPVKFVELLAENIDDLANASPPHHWHLEWFDGHFFLEEGSTACVFELVASMV